MQIGKRIKEIRKMKGYEGKHLAKSAGIAASSISDIEKDKRSPRLDTLEKICKGLGVSIYDVIEIEKDFTQGYYSFTKEEIEIIDLLRELPLDERSELLSSFKDMILSNNVPARK
jgi:transcriptional regulator with XRE-family HTH domain